MSRADALTPAQIQRVLNAVLNGVPIETVARILGHASPETTIDYVVIQPARIKQMCSIEWI
jgi:site-specific recombinase XerD